jgi:2-polyprenyl-3-methyl-5-hydroxy-6-metoxy-1,4-benzoquinol methylase
MTTVSNYGWQSETAPESCGYLAPKVLELIRVLGVSSVLDLGCGNGRLCGDLIKICKTVAGVEYDKQGYEIARSTYPHLSFFNLGVQDDPAMVLEEFPEKFEAVVSTEVVEHLFIPAQLPRFAAEILRPGGYLLLSTPYHGYLKNLALSIFNKWDHHHTPLWDGGHIKFWSRKTLGTLLNREGFSIVQFQGVGRVPWLWKSMILVARRN